MGGWAADFANMLKARENPSIIGAVLGVVVTPPPALKISILEGQVFLENVYVLDSVLSDYERTLDMPFESASGEITIQPYEVSREDGRLQSSKDYKINSFGIDKKQAVTTDTLKAGDEVLVISSFDNQKYFCLGKVRKVGG